MMAPLIRLASVAALLGLFIGLPFMAGADRPRTAQASSFKASSWPR